MKAYLTIVRDAFHAALASKVLYVMLGIIVLALLAIAPIGYRELRDYRVDNGDIRDPGRIVERLREASASDEPSNLKRVWLAISESSREQLETLLESSQNENDPFADSRRQGRLRQVLASQLRQAIEKDDLIDRELLTIRCRPILMEVTGQGVEARGLRECTRHGEFNGELPVDARVRRIGHKQIGEQL